MPRVQKVGPCDLALAASTSGTFLESQGPGVAEAVTIAQADVASLPDDLAAKAPLASPAFTGVVGAPTIDYGTQGGTIINPTPKTLWQQQPRDPQFGPWQLHSGGAFFSGIWDPVLYLSNNSVFAENHNPDESSYGLHFEINYFEVETGKYTFESYVEYRSPGQTFQTRPWMFTLDKATGSNRFAIDLGPVSSFGDFRVVSQDTILFQLDGGGISPSALDTVATISWSSLETFTHVSNSLGSTLALKGVPAKLHLDHGNSMVQWSNQWNVNINNADNLLYVRDLLNSRNQAVCTGASTSAVALTTFNSRVLANAQLCVINGAPLNFAARGNAISIGPSTQALNNYTHYISFSASGTAVDNTLNFEVGNGTISGHVTPLSLRGDNSAAFFGAVTIAGSLTVGGGTAISKILRASASLNFPSIAAGASAAMTISVTGATAGAEVVLGPPTAGVEAGLRIELPRVSAADTVTVTLTNTSGSPIDPAAATYRTTVFNP